MILTLSTTIQSGLVGQSQGKHQSDHDEEAIARRDVLFQSKQEMKGGKTNKQNGRARESETERQNESSNGRHGFGDREGHLFTILTQSTQSEIYPTNQHNLQLPILLLANVRDKMKAMTGSPSGCHCPSFALLHFRVAKPREKLTHSCRRHRRRRRRKAYPDHHNANGTFFADHDILAK